MSRSIPRAVANKSALAAVTCGNFTETLVVSMVWHGSTSSTLRLPMFKVFNIQSLRPSGRVQSTSVVFPVFVSVNTALVAVSVH